MWISKKKWRGVIRRLENCEGKIRENDKNFKILLYETVKKILRQPKELSKEIESVESIEAEIKKIINHQ